MGVKSVNKITSKSIKVFFANIIFIFKKYMLHYVHTYISPWPPKYDGQGKKIDEGEPNQKKVRDKQSITRTGSGCVSVGRAVASDTRGPRFESSHWQNFIYILNICLLSTVY